MLFHLDLNSLICDSHAIAELLGKIHRDDLGKDTNSKGSDDVAMRAFAFRKKALGLRRGNPFPQVPAQSVKPSPLRTSFSKHL
jgi:hypothetical protein